MYDKTNTYMLLFAVHNVVEINPLENPSWSIQTNIFFGAVVAAHNFEHLIFSHSKYVLENTYMYINHTISSNFGN